MNASFDITKRVLAIDPTSKGFGFAVLEGPDMLIDWGVRHAGPDRNRGSLTQAAALTERYSPEILVVEHTAAKGSRRRPRARRLVKSLLTLAKRHHVRPRRVPRRSVKQYFAVTRNKHQIALEIIRRFPELEPHLPRTRTFWHGLSESEDERTSYFDAIALALMNNRTTLHVLLASTVSGQPRYANF
jgi:hypothetical protein